MEIKNIHLFESVISREVNSETTVAGFLGMGFEPHDFCPEWLSYNLIKHEKNN